MNDENIEILYNQVDNTIVDKVALSIILKLDSNDVKF